MPEVTLVTADKRGSRFNSTQVAAVMPQSGPTNPLELEGFLDAYFADQMESLDFMGTGSNLELSRVLGYGLITILLFSLAVIGRNRQLKR